MAYEQAIEAYQNWIFMSARENTLEVDELYIDYEDDLGAEYGNALNAAYCQYDSNWTAYTGTIGAVESAIAAVQALLDTINAAWCAQLLILTDN